MQLTDSWAMLNYVGGTRPWTWSCYNLLVYVASRICWRNGLKVFKCAHVYAVCWASGLFRTAPKFPHVVAGHRYRRQGIVLSSSSSRNAQFAVIRAQFCDIGGLGGGMHSIECRSSSKYGPTAIGTRNRREYNQHHCPSYSLSQRRAVD